MQLHHNYKEFSDEQKQLLGIRVNDPVLSIQASDRGYFVKLGLLRGPSSKRRFIAAESVNHNWAWNGERIEVITYDAPKYVAEILGGIDSNKMSFSEVVALKRQRDTAVKIIIDESILENANVRSEKFTEQTKPCLLYTSPSPRDRG